MEHVLSVVADPGRFISRIKPYLGDGSSLLIGMSGATSILRIGSNVILTRLLAPEAYGMAAIVTSVAYVLVMMSDMGLRAYVTRHPTADDKLIQTVWTVRLLRNVVLALIMFLGAGAFANFYSTPEVTPAIRIASLLFLIDGAGSLWLMTSERNRRVIRLTLIDFARFVFVTLSAIAAAYFLRNFWAIIISMFVGQILSLLISYTLVKGPPIRFVLDRKHILDLWSFCRYVIPASMISIVLTQTDKFFLAKFFPLAELGKFMLASAIAVTISNLLGNYTMRVFFPRFAEAHRNDPTKTLSMFYADRRQVTLLLAFGVGGVIGGADTIVRVLFNDLYIGAGFYLAILCLAPLAKMSSLPTENAIITKGFIRISLIANILRLVWVLVAGPIAFFQAGPLAVVVVMSLTEIMLLPFFWWQQKRHDLLMVSEELFIFGAAAVGFLIGYVGNAAIHALISAGYLPSF